VWQANDFTGPAIEKNPDKLLTAKSRISDFLGHQNEGEEKIMNDNSSSSSKEDH